MLNDTKTARAMQEVMEFEGRNPFEKEVVAYAKDMMQRSIEKEVYTVDLVFDDLCERVMSFIVPKKANELRKHIPVASDEDIYFALIAGDLKQSFTMLNPEWVAKATMSQKMRLYTMHMLACAHKLIESGRTDDDDDLSEHERFEVLDNILDALANHLKAKLEDNVKRHFAESV